MSKPTLDEEIRAVRDRLERIRRDLSAPLDRDSSEQAIQLENRDVLMELERVETARLAELEKTAKSNRGK